MDDQRIVLVMSRRQPSAAAPMALAIGLLFLLPLLLFAPHTLGGRTLIPAENLYQFEPWHSEREALGASSVHNHLISDLVLQNYGWQDFARRQWAAGELPLWNPYLLAGSPFFAAGQSSPLYPLNLLFHLLPIHHAYGWYTVANLWLAGLGMFLYLRSLRLRHFAALLGGIVYQLASWLPINAVFPMIVATAAWLPWLLRMMEGMLWRQPCFSARRMILPWWLGGSLVITLIFFAGHAEMIIYSALIAVLYGLGRLVFSWRRGRNWFLKRAGWLATMALMGISLGTIQWLPLVEFALGSYRADQAEYALVAGEYAHPIRDLLLFLMPDIFGNTAHRQIHDWVGSAGQTGFTAPQNHTAWGIKNYVEGAVYLGILPIALAVLALVVPSSPGRSRPRVLLAALALLSASWMFGLPTYALIYYGLPGINQLHSPFRWIFALSFALAALAGIGADGLARGWSRARLWARRLGWGSLAIAVAAALTLLLSRLFYESLAPSLSTLMESISRAQSAFGEARWFYSHLFSNGLRFLAATAAAGLVLIGAGRARKAPWAVVAILVVAVDLWFASAGFYGGADPALLEHRPAAIEWLQEQTGLWRYTTLQSNRRPQILPANSGMRYGLEDIRGYESLTSARYVALMEALTPQYELLYSKIAPIYDNENYEQVLASPILELLNIRFLVAHRQFELGTQGWQLRWEDERLRIWEMAEGRQLPRAYAIPKILQNRDEWVRPAQFTPAEIQSVSTRRMELKIATVTPATLIISQNYDRNWRVYADKGDGENELQTFPIYGSLLGVELPVGADWQLRLVYSPRSFQLGAFFTLTGAALLFFLAGVAVWRHWSARPIAASGTLRLARNSLAPILLNLFNRSIDFLFAAFLLRVITPEEAGLYRTATILFVIFEIFTNFGLNTLLTREAARFPNQQRKLLGHTTALRLALFALASLPMTALIVLRLLGIPEPLDPRGAWVLALLYLGLLPGTISAGLTALFYARERAEYPATIASLASMNKVLLGALLIVLGAGIVGLAALSILTNLLTLLALLYGARAWLRLGAGGIDWRIDWLLLRRLAGESWPLMLNHFLAQIFFQIDILLIEIIHGTRMVAQYDIGYKWLLAVNVIPSFYTMALLPRLSRYAKRHRELLQGSYLLSIKLLVAIALFLAVWMTLAAEPLTAILGGTQYLPAGAVAIQLLAWSMPIGWVNSLTQYTLIALNQQRRVTGAFLLATSFNIIINLIFIPHYGFQAAALSTIASEAALLTPFLWALRRELLPLKLSDFWRNLWQPALAGGMTFAGGWLLWQSGWSAPALILTPIAYFALWLSLRPLSEAEWRRLRPLLPARLR